MLRHAGAATVSGGRRPGAGTWRMVLALVRQRRRLALATLAIVAYLQPVGRRQVAEIRGVGSESPLRTLLDRDLIQEVGRGAEVGQPILYGTTSRFLVAFDLDSPADLPQLGEFEVSGREREELMRRLGALLAPE